MSYATLSPRAFHLPALKLRIVLLIIVILYIKRDANGAMIGAYNVGVDAGGLYVFFECPGH